MHTEVTHRTTDTAVVIYVDGDLTTNTSPDVEAEVLDLIAGQAKHVIINVEKVNFIASTGLRVILALGKKLSGQGLKLMVCSMNSSTKSVFEMSGFARLFPTFASEEEALTNLS
jgi:anti-anti-sigma factor